MAFSAVISMLKDRWTASLALDSIYKGGDRSQRAIGSHKSALNKGAINKKEQ